MATCTSQTVLCPDIFGCPSNVCPDFQIKRYDTQPAFIVTVSDCNGPLDLTDTVVEISMWAAAKFKTAVTATDSSFLFADSIGFYQALPGDIIVVDRARSPEIMLVSGIDEDLKTIGVQRGYHGTTPASYKRGTALRIFRILNAIGDTNMVYDDTEGLDGTKEHALRESQLIYNWHSQDTCLRGCFWMEFKLLKMSITQINDNAPILASNIGQCGLGQYVEWVRKFPVSDTPFLIKILQSPLSESL